MENNMLIMNDHPKVDFLFLKIILKIKHELLEF